MVICVGTICSPKSHISIGAMEKIENGEGMQNTKYTWRKRGAIGRPVYVYGTNIRVDRQQQAAVKRIS